MAKKEKKNTNKENKNKKSFFKGLKAELKKVIWPTPKQLFNNTVAVITIVLITAAIVFVLDLAFESLNKHGVDKIKESIQTLESNNTNETNTTEETGNETTDSENTSAEENSTEGQEINNETTTEDNQENVQNNVE